MFTFILGALSALVIVIAAVAVWALRLALANAEHIRNVDAKTAASFNHIGLHLREVSEGVDELEEDLGDVESRVGNVESQIGDIAHSSAAH